MAKYCGKCGAQMNDNARICGMCGTPFAGPAPFQSPVNGSFAGGVSSTLSKMGIPGASGANGDLTIMYLGQTLLLVLLGILNFVKLFKLEIFGFEDEITLTELFGDDDYLDMSPAIPVIVGILIFVAAGLSVLPLFSTTTKKRSGAFQIVISIVAFLMVLIPYFIISGEADDYGALAEASLTFAGWLYLLICLGTILLSVLISKKSSRK